MGSSQSTDTSASVPPNAPPTIQRRVPEVVSGYQRSHDHIGVKSNILGNLVEGIDLRPKMLKDNPRAQLFPDIVNGVLVSTFKA